VRHAVKALRDPRGFLRSLPVRGLLFDRAKEVFGDGLVTCPHSTHRRKRRPARPACHRNRLSDQSDQVLDDALLRAPAS
jgi:hypothetical protein